MHKLLQSVQEEAIDLGLAFPDFDPQELTALLDRRKSLDQNQRDHWTALADPLQQIPSLNDAQIRQILQGLRLAVQQISKKPRRWAARTQANLQDSSDVFQDYLQHAHKSEFHPDRIKRHLQGYSTSILSMQKPQLLQGCLRMIAPKLQHGYNSGQI